MDSIKKDFTFDEAKKDGETHAIFWGNGGDIIYLTW